MYQRNYNVHGGLIQSPKYIIMISGGLCKFLLEVREMSKLEPLDRIEHLVNVRHQSHNPLFMTD